MSIIAEAPQRHLESSPARPTNEEIGSSSQDGSTRAVSYTIRSHVEHEAGPDKVIAVAAPVWTEDRHLAIVKARSIIFSKLPNVLRATDHRPLLRLGGRCRWTWPTEVMREPPQRREIGPP